MLQPDVAFRPLSTINETDGDSAALRLQVLVSPCPRHRDDSDVAVVKIVGELDSYSAQLVEPALRRFVLFADDVAIDLSEVSFIDAAGLCLLNSLAEGALAVRLENPGPRISHLFEIAGLSHVCDGPGTRIPADFQPCTEVYVGGGDVRITRTCSRM